MYRERVYVYILQIAQAMVVLAVKLSFHFQQFIDLLGITDDLEGAKITVHPHLTYFSKHIW